METRASLGVGIIGSTAKAVAWVALVTLALGAFSSYAFAQEPVAAADDKVLSKDELNTLVGKIALYPDDLVAIVLPASTYPLQVVEAERFLQERKKDPSLKPSDKWDDSVVALLNYPEVVKLMNDDLDWTWKLGDAVINQRGEVLDAIQSFRGQAKAAGNLHTDEHQVVQNDDQGEVSIKPADPQVVYVPYYDPQQVVVAQPAPVYYYYPYGYPLYYYPYPYGYSFAAGYFWGVTTAFVIGWHSHYVHVVHCGYYGHPYYGHTYYGGYYVRHDSSPAMSHGNYVWEPHYRAGGQPFTRSDGRQLAIAHHDPKAGGAPSGYRSDRYGDGGRGVSGGHYAVGGHRGDGGHGADGGHYANGGRGGDGGHPGDGGHYANGGHGDGGHTGDGGHDSNGGHGGDGDHSSNGGHGSGGGHQADGGHYSNGGHGSDGGHGSNDGNNPGGGRAGDGGHGSDGGHGPQGGHDAVRGPSGGTGYRAGVNPGITAPSSRVYPGVRGGGQSVAPTGARDGMKQIQPIHNDPPTQAAIRSELRQHAPSEPTLGAQGSQNGSMTTPAQPERRYTYQTPNQSMTFRDPAARNAPQANAPQYRGASPGGTAQYRSGSPATAPQYRSAPQMRTMPAPSGSTTMAMPHQGGASYGYRAPSGSSSVPQASAGHASSGRQGGGAAHGSQSHGSGHFR